jgi:serine/threonine protein kinase
MMEIRKLTPGDRILDYRILESIGEGGFGEVFRAEHEVLGRVVAIKVPRDLEALSALRLEGVIQANLQHPGIVKTLEISISYDPPYVVMEYIDGESLRRLLERGGLPWKRAVKIMIDVCRAVEHAHNNGVIHGDIKPGNVLVPASEKESARITDFGLSKVFDAQNNANLQISRSLNFAESASEIVGTLRYLAPEVQRGEKVDSLADIYSIGVLLFEVLTGGLPEGREVPSDVKKGIPGSLDDLFCRCFVRKNRRMKTVAEIIAELECILESKGFSIAEKANRDAAKVTVEKAKTQAPIKKEAKFQPKVETPQVEEKAPLISAMATLPVVGVETDGSCFPYDEDQFPTFVSYQEDLWSSLRDTLTLPEGIEEIESRGFDIAFGVLNDGDPQHRIFACAVPQFNGEAAREFVNQGSRVFDLEKGLWEKEVTFVIAANSITEKDKVDWALRSFSTGWWRRRRVVLYDLSQDQLIAQEYGCDPGDNPLKKSFLEQLKVSNQQIIFQRQRCMDFTDACRQRSSRIGTALTVFSTFCVIALGLSLQNGKALSTRPSKDLKEDHAHPVMRAVESFDKATEAQKVADDAKKKEYQVKLPVRLVEDH